jgi:hypothetical protein
MFSFRAPFVEMLPLLPDRALVVLFFVGLFSLPFAKPRNRYSANIFELGRLS